MKIELGGYHDTIDARGGEAVLAEASGFDTWWGAEIRTDPLLAAAVVAERTERIGIGTGIVVAFGRSP